MNKDSKLYIELVEWAKSIAFALVIGALVLVFARPSLIIGPSMEPTFLDKQVVLVEKVSYFTGQPQRGDVIVAKTQLPLNKFFNKSIIKRVVGLPGDVIRVADGEVFINGVKYYESYIRDGFTPGDGEWQVPQHSVFVMGDNRANSNDSRRTEVGFIDFSKIQGKVYLRVFPFNQIRGF